jgi:5,10-methylenetetrahydrofolate reductase
MNTDTDVIDCNGQVPVFFEIVPPAEGNQEKRLKSHKKYIRMLLQEAEVDALNLPEIQNESQKGEKGKRKMPHKKRVSPRRYTRSLSENFDTNYVINHVCVNHPHAALENWLIDTHAHYDISHVILVGGESSRIQYEGPTVTDGNRLVKQYLNRGKCRYSDSNISPTNFTIGNICIPTRRRNDFDEPERMLQKCKAGADFFTSQIITEAETPISLLKDFSELLEKEGLENDPPAIFWSLSPVSSQTDIDFMRWLGVHIPDSTERFILGSDNPAATSLDIALNVFDKVLDYNDQLPVPIPMGMNISVMGLRNFENGILLARELETA